MNVNEVLANRASELLGGERGPRRLLHPNDDVNLGQSSNDVFPDRDARCRGARARTRDADPGAGPAARRRWRRSARPSRDIVKIGRTHLQDATPLTLGQEFSGYVAQLEQSRQALRGRAAGRSIGSRSAAPRSAPA